MVIHSDTSAYPSVIDPAFLSAHLQLTITTDFACNTLGLVNSQSSDAVLTFVDQAKFITQLNANTHIKAVFVTAALAQQLRADIFSIVVDDPRWYFFTLQNILAELMPVSETVIAASSNISNHAVVDDFGVVIEGDVIIEPLAVVRAGSHIMSGSVIRSGAIIGVDGFEHKRTTKGIVSVKHDGQVIIGKNCEVGANCNVARGFAYRHTILGEDTKLDGLVHIAHGVQCGRACLFAANAMIAGSVTLGNGVWTGPSVSVSNGLTIGDNASLTIGSVVTRDVEPGKTVTGNFAIEHRQFLKNLKKQMTGS